MNDLELLTWAIAECGKKYVDQSANMTRFCESIKQSWQTVHNWKVRNRLPAGWRMYFQSQYDKKRGKK